MSAWTSLQAGNWSRSSENADSPWYDGGAQSALASVPGNGDSVQTDHDVVVDVNTTVGTTPDDTSTNAILVESGTLTIAAGVTLTCRGRLYLSGAGLTLEAGAEILLDSSQHATLTPMYQINGSNSGNVFTFNGTSGAHCAIRGYNDTYRGHIDFNTWSGGDVTVTYTDFEDLGSGSTHGVDSYLTASGLSVTDCTFTDCAGVRFRNNRADEDFVFSRNVFSGTGSASTYLYALAPTTGARECEDNVFDVATSVAFYLPGATIKRCYFHETFNTSLSTDTAGDIEDCFLRGSGGNSCVNAKKGMVDCYLLNENESNPHVSRAYTEDRNITFDGNVFESTYNGGQSGDLIFATSDANASYKATIKNNLVLPNAAGASMGCLINTIYGPNWFADVYHNTMAVGQGLLTGEGFEGETGAIANCKSNLWWKKGAAGGYAAVRLDNAGTPVQDIITPANYDYNWHYNLATGSEGNSFHDYEDSSPSMFSTVPTNSNGGTTDPQFVDDTRNLASWGASEAGTDGSVAAALAVLQSDTTKIPELVAWVKDGFKVTNPDLNNAGHDGVTIGAMGYISSHAGTADVETGAASGVGKPPYGMRMARVAPRGTVG
jgi:hypothetical protein